MKFIKWKILIISSIICLFPIVLGIILWNELPSQIAIHFDINNNPDNFSSKGLVVFGLPVLVAVLQAVCCIINDINSKKYSENKKIENLTKWIIPVITVILQIVTLGYAVGQNFDIRRIAMLIAGGIFIVTGLCLPKLDYIKNYNINSEKARKINKFIGIQTVIMGILFIISIFFPPIASVICLYLLIPYSLIGILYGLKISNKAERQ